MKNFLILFLLSIVVLMSGCGSDSPVSGTGGTTLPSSLTRTGKFIAYTSNLSGNNDIWLAQVNSSGILETANLVFGTNPYNLTSNNTTSDKMANWSPDGKVLVFSRTTGTSEEIWAYFFTATGSLDTTVSPNPKNLFTSGGNWDNNASFSSDGAYLVFDRRYDNSSPVGVDSADSRDIYFGTISGSGNSFAIANIHAIVYTPGKDESNPKWAPKNSVRRVAYEYGGSGPASDHDINIIDPLDTNNMVKYFGSGRSGHPAWEPSCTKIIYEADNGNGGFYKIVIGDYPTVINTTDIYKSNNEHNRYPTWLPNGGLIAFINIPASGLGNIYIIGSTGGTPRKLLPSSFDGANNVYPAW